MGYCCVLRSTPGRRHERQRRKHAVPVHAVQRCGLRFTAELRCFTAGAGYRDIIMPLESPVTREVADQVTEALSQKPRSRSPSVSQW